MRPVYDLVNCGPRNSFVIRGAPDAAPMIVHNCTQAVARDLLADAMIRLDDADFQIVLTVHDEVIADEPLERDELDEFTRIMSIVPVWATGIPIKVESWKGKRYRK